MCYITLLASGSPVLNAWNAISLISRLSATL
ncbi:hypothetical protein FHS40_008817 [Streptomyces spectabilis]|uniref:Uncharacterized protein n=1 Tax=Streptomyces spectabilis TaxID=68270 RepID=A0A7W8B6E2_STRST|nr:hypothetical protein [Streptomyces spectabilis]